MTKTEIIHFINQFTGRGKREQVIDTFTGGCCYWFSFILFEKFKQCKPEIVYDIIENHFGCRIGDNVYDITGDVTNKFNWVLWSEIEKRDSNHAQYITRDCINFERSED